MEKAIRWFRHLFTKHDALISSLVCAFIFIACSANKSKEDEVSTIRPPFGSFLVLSYRDSTFLFTQQTSITGANGVIGKYYIDLIDGEAKKIAEYPASNIFRNTTVTADNDGYIYWAATTQNPYLGGNINGYYIQNRHSKNLTPDVYKIDARTFQVVDSIYYRTSFDTHYGLLVTPNYRGNIPANALQRTNRYMYWFDRSDGIIYDTTFTRWLNDKEIKSIVTDNFLINLSNKTIQDNSVYKIHFEAQYPSSVYTNDLIMDENGSTTDELLKMTYSRRVFDKKLDVLTVHYENDSVLLFSIDKRLIIHRDIQTDLKHNHLKNIVVRINQFSIPVSDIIDTFRAKNDEFRFICALNKTTGQLIGVDGFSYLATGKIEKFGDQTRYLSARPLNDMFVDEDGVVWYLQFPLKQFVHNRKKYFNENLFSVIMRYDGPMSNPTLYTIPYKPKQFPDLRSISKSLKSGYDKQKLDSVVHDDLIDLLGHNIMSIHTFTTSQAIFLKKKDTSILYIRNREP